MSPPPSDPNAETSGPQNSPQVGDIHLFFDTRDLKKVLYFTYELMHFIIFTNYIYFSKEILSWMLRC